MRIAIITGSRADWNGLGMVAMALRDAGHDVTIIGTAAESITPAAIAGDSFSSQGGWTESSGDTQLGVAFTMADSLAWVARSLSGLKPDLVILCGDRYEILAAAVAAAMLRIPIAHIAGGDVTRGSIDDRLRNAITMLADLHFPTNDYSYERILIMQMTSIGVHMVGSPAVDRIRVTPRVSRRAFFNEIGLPNGPTVVVSFHPATAEPEPTRGCIEMLAACKDLNDEVKPKHLNWLLIGSNADAGGQEIERLMLIFKSICDGRSAFVRNLPPHLYYSALECDMLIGNSSAGLYEAPSFGIPVVNIGDRQKGRLAAANVRTCAPTRDAILYTMKLQLAEGRKPCVNPYGDGHSAPRIAKIIGEWRP